MQTRYYFMVRWGFEFLFFAAMFCILLSLLKIVSKKMKISLDSQHMATFYTAEMISGILLAIVVGVRCNCGSDYYNYYLQSINNGGWFQSYWQVAASRFQFGLSFLIRMSNEIFQSQYAIFVVVAFITIIPTFYLIAKRVPYPVLGIMTWILLGYLSMSANILKQAVAMTVVLCFYEKLYNKQYKRAVLCALTACIFHTASLYVIVVILLFRNIDFTKKIMIILSSVSLLLVIGMKPIFSRIIAILPYQYSKYLSIFLGDSNLTLKLFLGGILVSVFYILVIWNVLGKADIFDEYMKPMVGILVMCVPVLLLGLRVYLFNRIAYFGLQFIIFLLPVYIKQYRKPMQRMACVTLVLFCFLFSILCSENEYYAYSTVYNSEPLSVMAYAQKYQNP